MINHYRASQGVTPLTNFVQETSKESYKDLIDEGVLGSQCARLFRLYNEFPDGLTDVEASKFLTVDPSTLSARRNDLTKRYGSHVLIKNGTRDNGERRRKGIVWKLNPHLLR